MIIETYGKGWKKVHQRRGLFLGLVFELLRGRASGINTEHPYTINRQPKTSYPGKLPLFHPTCADTSAFVLLLTDVCSLFAESQPSPTGWSSPSAFSFAKSPSDLSSEVHTFTRWLFFVRGFFVHQGFVHEKSSVAEVVLRPTIRSSPMVCLSPVVHR
jgi:hypothetical protein